MSYADYVFGKPLSSIDPAVSSLVTCEEERQARKIILVPSESLCPAPVLDALGSAFSNIYAEGYPSSMMEGEDEDDILDFDFQLTRYRRYADRRFYKGCEYANLVEMLASRRAAKLFQTEKTSAENIFVNVQSLSGSSANNSVYDAFVRPGDVVMGMSLVHGGHLTHGSEFNRSGKNYRVVSYGINNVTERLDYDEIMALAKEHRPGLIIAGYTSYPWAPDWKRFREIADEVGAILLADVAHTAGLVVAGVHPNPIDYADVVTFTTHKTLFGPRGAVIMTTRREHAERIDKAVFPGEQGGPHVNKFAAMAVAFRIAASDEFKAVQKAIVENAQYLAGVLGQNGLKLAYGGTDTHIVLIDLNSIHTKSGFPLKGETAVRILDLAGIVANKNTIPGDTVTAEASGVRLGTPWISQRGITKEGVEELGDIMACVLKNIYPFSYIGLTGTLPRGKIDFRALEEAKARVDALAGGLAQAKAPIGLGYPHFTVPLQGVRSAANCAANTGAEHGETPCTSDTNSAREAGARQVDAVEERDAPVVCMLVVRGRRAQQFLQETLTGKVDTMNEGEGMKSFLLDGDGQMITPVILYRLGESHKCERRFLLICRSDVKEKVAAWLRGLADGYLLFDRDDLFRKIEGPVAIVDWVDVPEAERAGISTCSKKLTTKKNAVIDEEFLALEGEKDAMALYRSFPGCFDLSKPYFIGQHAAHAGGGPAGKGEFSFSPARADTRRSCLYEEHLKRSATMVNFAGWMMPVWYESIIEEHRAVRQMAGLFDVSHMGVLEVSGRHAEQFLDAISTNYVPWIGTGESQYSYLLDPDGNVIDDIIVYRESDERFILVVNAANNERDFAWLNAVNSKEYFIDREDMRKEIVAEVTIKDIKGGGGFEARLVNIALQGSQSLNVLMQIAPEDRVRARLRRLERARFFWTELGGIELIVTRTGYTGEEIGYELLLHPSKAPAVWNILLDAGKPFGVRPVGLGARDSLRIEAGLPLHGHELAGPLNISPIEAGFGPYVKFHKPFFIGRGPLLKRTSTMKRTVVRFRMLSKGVRVVKQGDMVLSTRTQRIIGSVTSCAVNHEGIQVGMACVDARFSREGTQIGLVPSPPGDRRALKPLEQLSVGDRFPLHEDAVILCRFLLRKQ